VYEVAVGNYNGLVELYENQELTGLSSVINKTGTSILVPVNVCDEIVTEESA